MCVFTVESDDCVGNAECVTADALVGHEIIALQRGERELHRRLVVVGLVFLFAVPSTLTNTVS